MSGSVAFPEILNVVCVVRDVKDVLGARPKPDYLVFGGCIVANVPMDAFLQFALNKSAAWTMVHFIPTDTGLALWIVNKAPTTCLEVYVNADITSCYLQRGKECLAAPASFFFDEVERIHARFPDAAVYLVWQAVPLQTAHIPRRA